MTSHDYPVLEPALQIEFSRRLVRLSSLYLHEALAETLLNIPIPELDAELAQYVEEPYLKRLAMLGLRGETIFPVPLLLIANPGLLGYYRLLFGFSQKEIYTKGPFGRFKILEEKGIIPSRIETEIELLCISMWFFGGNDGIANSHRD